MRTFSYTHSYLCVERNVFNTVSYHVMSNFHDHILHNAADK